MQVLETQTIEEMFKDIKLSKAVKGLSDHNPVMTQRFGADPYALIYGGRVYLYMTGDMPEYDTEGKLLENTYSKINTINVISSEDLVNWTDHGTVYASSETGAAKWGANSWAPAAAYKNIDGKDRFFLYFANNGNGIAVLSADSPVGPFTDPVNGPLISRATPNCADVTWLFDPAVLMDDDGSAYIYVGGGVPSLEKAANPGTARVAKLGDDMISLACDPQPIENVPFLFEDSGINKIGDKYFYSYCSNFSMKPEDEEKAGYNQGEIVTLVSESPMGPFEVYKPVLKNPQYFFGRGGNNHHCMFEFKGNWYITYHSRILEELMDMNGGYRSTNVDVLEIKDGGPSVSKGTRKGVEQLSYLNPYEDVKAVTMANSAGINTRQYGEEAEKYGSGEMVVTDIKDGSWLSVSGADFGKGEPFELSLKVTGNGTGAVRVSLDSHDGEVLAYVPVESKENEVEDVFVTLANVPSGVHDIYFTFVGAGYELISWRFVK